MAIGYACIARGLRNSGMRGLNLKNASLERIDQIIETNLQNLSRILDYNMAREIKLFRISSDVIPFGSHPINSNPWWETHGDTMKSLGEKIRNTGLRVSMHPGQYTVLNSLDPAIADRAVADLEYHVRFLDSLGIGSQHKIVIHIGGIYGDRQASIARFIKNYSELSDPIKNRLVIENDEKYNIADVLHIATVLDVPVIFDVFHHHCFPAPDHEDINYWLDQCQKTWQVKDGIQKIHYSQQEPGLRVGAHARSIKIEPFLEFYRRLPQRQLDIMLEVKDKDLSAIKCISCVDSKQRRNQIEEEWARYKYTIMEHSHIHYQTIGKMLNPSLPLDPSGFYLLVEEALQKAPTGGQAWNAAQHVWGYFKKVATEKEKIVWQKRAGQFQRGEIARELLKSTLMRLAAKYDMKYLLDSYYFILD